MRRDYHRVLLLFVDGIGLAPTSASNPLSRDCPTIEGLLGGGLVVESCRRDPSVLLRGLDATLGVRGLPQSATGQTALFTGLNAAAEVGRHVTGFPGSRLNALIEKASIFLQASESGLSATFANAYSGRYREALAQGNARASVTTRAMLAAALPLRTMEDLAAGRAITWDIERDLFGRRFGRLAGRPPTSADGEDARSPRWVEPMEVIPARRAGEHLADLAGGHRLTVFETFLADLAGHGRIDLPAPAVVARLDGLLAGLLGRRPPDLTVVLTSDHGNFEDPGPTHTRAPVPLFAVGPAAAAFSDLESITGVAPRILEILGKASS